MKKRKEQNPRPVNRAGKVLTPICCGDAEDNTETRRYLVWVWAAPVTLPDCPWMDVVAHPLVNLTKEPTPQHYYDPYTFCVTDRPSGLRIAKAPSAEAAIAQANTTCFRKGKKTCLTASRLEAKASADLPAIWTVYMVWDNKED